MNALNNNEGQNEAVTLLNKILNNPSLGDTSNEQQVVDVATNCTQLLNNVAASSSLLKHPSVLAATHLHPQLISMAGNIATNAGLAKTELLSVHSALDSLLSSFKPTDTQGTKLLSMIEIYQAYEIWMEKFTYTVLSEYGELTKLIETVDLKEVV